MSFGDVYFHENMAHLPWHIPFASCTLTPAHLPPLHARSPPHTIFSLLQVENSSAKNLIPGRSFLHLLSYFHSSPVLPSPRYGWCMIRKFLDLCSFFPFCVSPLAACRTPGQQARLPVSDVVWEEGGPGCGMRTRWARIGCVYEAQVVQEST